MHLSFLGGGLVCVECEKNQSYVFLLPLVLDFKFDWVNTGSCLFLDGIYTGSCDLVKFA